MISFSTSFATTPFHVFFQQKIPMRDGVNLSADLYLQTTMTSTKPALFVITPYTTDGVFATAAYFAKNGYNVVVVDCRGRGNSEGEFVPFDHDGKDGYDVCKWIASQPWCNGKIGMFGGSYLGMVQWLTVKEKPEALKTIIPIASVGPGIDFPKLNNIFYSYNTEWLTFTYGKTGNPNAFTDVDYWNDIFATMFIKHAPYSNMDVISGIKSEVFKNWLKHPAYDDYYKSIQLGKDDYENINIPVLVITGHFDDDQPGTMNYYRNYMQYRKEEAKNQCYIVIGPWDHGGTRRPSLTLGNLTFNENSKIDILKLQLDWFNHTLNNAPLPEFLKNKASVYEMGSDVWQYASQLPELSPKVQKLYLHSSGNKATDVYNSGELSANAPEEEGQDSFIYNPLDTTYSSQKIQNAMINYAWREAAEAFYPDKLVYHSKPLTADMSFTGFLKFTAYISMDVPDTDLEAILYEIQPDGKCIYLTSSIMRARYRNSLEKEELVKPGEINEYVFNTFHYTSRVLKKGSRLRLVFGTLNSPYFQLNYNSGKDVSFETARDTRTANIKLYHDAKHPTYIEVPGKE
jgi:putative CocE/NonD family hydrolase